MYFYCTTILCVIVEDQNRTWFIFYIMFLSYCFALNFLFIDQVFIAMNTITHSSPSTKDYLPFLLSFKSHCQAQQSVLLYLSFFDEFSLVVDLIFIPPCLVAHAFVVQSLIILKVSFFFSLMNEK